jgi:flagellar basal-body rod protein FlgB
MEASSISNKLFEQLNFRGERQKVISSNIANINTPGYKTKELVFEDELNNSITNNSLQLKATNSKHMTNINSSLANSNPKLMEVDNLEEQNDGNNVNLDTQMGEMSKNKILFDAIQSSIKRDSKLFRSVVESSAKN